MSQAAAAAPPAEKKGKKKLFLIVGGAVVLVAGSIGAGVYAATSMMGGGHGAAAADPNAPKLVPRAHGEGAGHGENAKYEATYYPIEQSFTANLGESESLVQCALSVSTYYDAKVTDAVKKHETPIRSAVLETLAAQDPLAITTPAGKKALQAALTKAINATLVQKEGFGGIDNVYFTSFIVQ